MKHAETVTFGGATLDRAAQLRSMPDQIDALATAPETRILPLWRLKPLVKTGETRELGWQPPDSPVFDTCTTPPIFLGLEGKLAHFARVIPDWDDTEVDAAAFLDATEQSHPGLGTDYVFAELRAMMAELPPQDAAHAATARGIQSWHDTHKFCARCGGPSESDEAGWRRKCGTCGALHFPRTDPVVIMLITYQNKVLIGRAPNWPDGMYSLLAGFVEPGETLEAAVRREVFEETAIRVGEVGYLASQPWPFPSSLMFGCRGEATSTEITCDPAEIEDAFWLDRETALAAINGQTEGLWLARKGSIARFLIENWLADTLA